MTIDRRDGLDTRFARRASRESDGFNGFGYRGSPLGIGQPRAKCLDTFGVVSMPRYARKLHRDGCGVPYLRTCVSQVRPDSGTTWVNPIPAGGLGMRIKCWQ